MSQHVWNIALKTTQHKLTGFKRIHSQLNIGIVVCHRRTAQKPACCLVVNLVGQTALGESSIANPPVAGSRVLRSSVTLAREFMCITPDNGRKP
jgi:hypothetical protein